MKCEIIEQEEVEFQDIMGLPMTVKSSDIAEVVRENVQSITKQVAEKIIELNGDKSVSAVFVVGGGGKITGFTDVWQSIWEWQKKGLHCVVRKCFVRLRFCVRI